MKKDTLPTIQNYSFKQTLAYKKMEELACKLIVDNQDINLLGSSKIFKDKAALAIKENNADTMKKFGLKDAPVFQDLSKQELRIQYDKYKATLEAETKKHEKLTVSLEETTKEYLDREIELNTLIFQQNDLLLYFYQIKQIVEARRQRNGAFQQSHQNSKFSPSEN